ncbi:MAG: hypothetical protein ACYSR1_05185 [Planctomycetota bacterium]|jgi:hypothetical protein
MYNMVVISIAGAKKGDWSSYEDTLNRMSPFEFIDMKRFEKKRNRTTALRETCVITT